MRSQVVRHRPSILGVLGLLAIACSGTPASSGAAQAGASQPSLAASVPSGGPSSAASSAELLIHLSAHIVGGDATGEPHWDASELRAPAGEAFQIDYRNATHEQHNIVIQDSAAKVFFASPNTALGQTFEIPAMAAGTYEFICTLHPLTMKGPLVVGP
jgi:plastocyanin